MADISFRFTLIMFIKWGKRTYYKEKHRRFTSFWPEDGIEVDAKENKYMFMSCEESNGTAIPLQAWTGPEGSRRLRLPDFRSIGT